jgi:hypothetical protein
VSPPCFGRVRAAARYLLLETEGAERDRDALGAYALALLDDRPEGVEAACWRKQRRDCDRLNRFLNEGIAAGSGSSTSKEPPRGDLERFPDRGGEVRALRSPAEPLRAIPLPMAIELLADVEIPRSGMVRCPLPGHDDRSPSFSVDDEVFHCFGCLAGGRGVIDFAALLWEIEPRGSGFHEIRERLEADLLPALRRAAA